MQYCSRDIDEMKISCTFKHETIEDSLMIIKPNAFKYGQKITQLLKSKEFNAVGNVYCK